MHDSSRLPGPISTLWSTREPYGVWGGMSEEERRAYYERQARRFADEPA